MSGAKWIKHEGTQYGYTLEKQVELPGLGLGGWAAGRMVKLVRAKANYHGDIVSGQYRKTERQAVISLGAALKAADKARAQQQTDAAKLAAWNKGRAPNA